MISWLFRMFGRKGLVLASALAVLALLLLRVVIGGARSPEIAPVGDAADARSGRDDAPSAPVSPVPSRQEALAPAQEALAPALGSATARPVPDRPVETLARSDGLQVLVRMKASGAPVPGALVTFVDFGALAARRRTELSDPMDRDLAAARFGQLFRADEDGIAIVPRSRAASAR